MSSTTATFIRGSTAAGEALPPHFQFSTKATSSERERIRLETCEHMLNVRGQFGFNSEQVFPTTLGMNDKGGMENEEFEEYLNIHFCWSD